MNRHARRSVFAIWLLAAATPAFAEEGKWTPQQLLQLDPGWLKQMGLQVPVSRLWDPQRGTGLLAASVNTGGCSGGFVSANGLIVSNHHCFFGILQEHSRPDRDLMTNGFLALNPDEELPDKTARVTVPRRFTVVTGEVNAAVAAGSTDLERAKAIDVKQKALVATCEKTPGTRCQVASFDGGVEYTLIEALELTDIRLVYAPPRAIGEFGGEVDNFQWPRHVGDFAVARAYKDGKPYRPEFFFSISTAGVKPSDFVMVLGYPGRTLRSMTAEEMANERRRFEMRADLYGEWIRLLELATRDSQEGQLAVAATLKSLNNSRTNALGQIAGLTRGNLIEKQRDVDRRVMEWASRQGSLDRAVAAKRELDARAEQARAVADRSYLLSIAGSGAVLLRDALTLVRLASERLLSDTERDPAYQSRQWRSLRARLERTQASYYRPADEVLLESWVARALQVDPAQQIAALDTVFQRERVKEHVAAIYRATRVADLRARLAMFEESPDQLRARQDPLIELAFALDPLLRAEQVAVQASTGATARLRPEWRQAVIAHAGKPVAPDANSTLRVSFAHVLGYSPRDGVYYTPQSTLAGMIEKHTGDDPFSVPKFVRDAAAGIDARQVPLNFLANGDTTGGNSGSPVVNGKGELVGLNFDRPWENVANDFGYNPDVARNISVDIRFLVWLLKIQHADRLIEELGVK